ncbi:cobalt-precorrin-6A reductase [Streptomyces sp. P38-E01]|uniref:Cobalt-precorrin-6A reductase n=1 Tax=Streptomyces tardus TaxID=2780544 RepID=A0A949N1N3_9ACTN|nr:cobalt-precorrin-6A reductase [Streptomyces tardus]MBU7598025.1 cobalt-precorrin-6A reductase [Streptomyces tardus]
MKHVLILGGTADARHLATELLAERPELKVTSSLAGRVSRPRLPGGGVRVGGFGGAAGLASWLRAHRVDALVDATHPFAATMSRNAAHAAADTDVPLLAVRRPPWRPEAGDRWHEVESLAQAASLLPELGRRAFLTTGRGELRPFRDRAPLLWYLIRSVDAPDPADCPPHHQLLLSRGPFTLEHERARLADHHIDVLVTKNSGGSATAPKLLAARERGIPVVLLRRPPAPEDVPTAPDVQEALRLLLAR